MNNDLILSPIPKQELLDDIRKIISEQIANLKPQSEPDVLLTQKQTMDLMKCSEQWLISLKKQGKIPFKKIGSRCFYSKNAILKLIQDSK